MPNLIGTHRALLADAVVPTVANVLTIVGGNVNPLINAGEQQLSVVDQNSNPVTPDSWSSGTPGNVTVSSAGLIRGVAESGTSVISAIKSGYTTGTITVTCSGGLYSLDPNTLSQTNGQAISTISDSGSVAWAQAVGGNQPTCFRNATSGRRSILFDGTNDYLQAASHIAAFDGTTLSAFMAIKPVTQGAAQAFWANSSLGTTGFFVQIFTDNKYYLDVATAFTGTGSTGTAITTATYSRVGFTLTTSAQNVYINGASIGTNAYTYANGTQTAGPFLGAGSAASLFYGGYVGLMLTYNRVITGAEIAQVDLRLANEVTALTA